MRSALLATLAMALSACGGTDAKPTCLDGEQNGAETDVDCGGPSCGHCFDGHQCLLAYDCISGLCTAGRCYANYSTGGGGGTSTGGGGGSSTGGGGGSSTGGGGGSSTGGGGGTSSGGGGGTSTGGGGGSLGGGGGSTGGGGGSLGGGGGSTGGGGGSLGGGAGGGGGSAGDTLLISQVQTRGEAGGNDEFIELYNPGNAPVVFDSTWSLTFRSATGTCSTNLAVERYSGAGQIIPARGYLLLTNSGYNGTVASDGAYSLGLVDAGSLVLLHASATVDALCFQFDAPTLAALTTCSPAYACEGTPLLSPHNNTTATTSNQDTGLQRKTGQDTQDNTFDFVTTTASNPRNRFSAPFTP